MASPSGLLNSSDLRHEFLSLYPNRATHIYKAPGDPNWKVSRFRLATGLIDAAISTECDTFYGSFWDVQTPFAVLDIDNESAYHNAQELQRLRENLELIGLSSSVLFQSSNSNGWHLYIPFFDPVPSKEVEAALKAWLKSLGYDIRGGQLEVFPSGNGLRLPLQRGFAWLDDAGAVITRREELELDAALSRFLLDLNENCNDWTLAKSLIETQKNSPPAVAGGDAPERRERLEMGGFGDLFSGGKIQENWEKGRKFWQEGLTSSGQRHDAVLFIGHYLWYGDPDNGIAALPGARNDKYRATLIEDWLTDKHNGFCNHIDRNKWDTIRAQIKRAVLWRGNGQAREYEPYRLTDRLLKRLLAIYRKTGKVWTVEDFKQANEDRRDEARCKIRAAVDQCLNEGRQISRSTIAAITGCSPNTLKKHADLWKLFAIGSGECNRGVQGAVPLSVVRGPESSEKEKEFLEPSDVLGEKPEIDAVIQPGCSFDPVLEIGSQGNYVLPACSPVIDGRWRRRGKATGRRQRGSLASPSHTQPIKGSKQKNPVCTCGLNGFLPSSAEPPLGPPHLNPRKLFSKGSGLVMLQEGGSSQAEAHSGVNPPTRDALQSGRYGNDQRRNRCIRVNNPCGYGLQGLVYSDVRGPPIWITAQTASLENDDTAFGASYLELCSTIGATEWHVYGKCCTGM